MSQSRLRISGPGRAFHPAVMDRRAREFVLLAFAGVVPALIAMVLTVELPYRDLPLILAGLLGLIGIVVLIVSTRLEVTLALVLLYLGLLDGPIKLGLGAHELTAGIRNVLILAVCLGAIMRIVVRRERVRLPPLSGWVFAFVAVTAIEIFNPRTEGVLKVVGGFRQQLQWVPFFFFGYLLMRSKKRFQRLFLIVGVISLANGAVSAYQTELTPPQLARWGPGYQQLIYPTSGTGRTYSSEGEARVRPPGLGDEAGSGGGWGVIALPFGLALMATLPPRRRWLAVVLCLGALLAIITGLGRLQVVGAGIGVLAFAALASIGGQRVVRTIGVLLAIVVVAVPAGLLLTSALRSGTFKRYESINVTSSSTALHKESALALIPHYLEAAPFGFGLGSVGSVASFGGKVTELINGHGVSSETQYNLVVNELGAPGLAVWVAMVFYVLALIARGMRRVRNSDLVIELAAMFAPFVALFFESTSGPISSSTSAGPYFWFAMGVASYWLLGPGLKALGTRAKTARRARPEPVMVA